MNRCVYFLAICGFLLCGAITLCREKKQSTPNASIELSVTVVKPVLGSIDEVISATGKTVPREEIQIMTELSGVKVCSIFADVGNNVTKGQKIAVLDGESFFHKFIQIKNNYEKSCAAFIQVDGIKETGAVSRQLVLDKRFDMQIAKSELDEAELNMKRCTIIAHETGMIIERKAAIGKLVSANEPMFRIARNGEIEIEAMIPESVLFQLKVDQHVSVILAGESRSTHGSIRLITPCIDNATRLAAIRIRLQRSDPLPVGLFATVRIILPECTGVLLPKTARQQDDSGDFVWAVNAKNQAERLPVNVLVFGAEQVLVGTISSDIRVVAKAGAFIKEGDRLHVIEDL